MRISLSIFFVFLYVAVGAQDDLTISGQTFTNSSDTWAGVNIPRSSPTKLIFRNNTITSRNRFGYMLQAGDESPSSTNNNLDGAVITGNRLNWTGSDMDVIPHGLFTGHNRNVLIKWNYLNYVPMGIITKSGNNMSNSGGGIAYNIVKGGAVAMVVKGISNVNIFNNTFYTDRTSSQTWRPLLYIYTNTDQGKYSVAHGTKVYNNIFYTKFSTPSISVLDAESLKGFECDYNVYWCENGAPFFMIGDTRLSFTEWQMRGYDTHSVVMDPLFRDLVNFIPDVRINRGTDLGSEWVEGLSVSARWGTTDPATTLQNGPWQAGAVIHGNEGGETGSFEITQAVLSGPAPLILEIFFSQELASAVPPVGAFIVKVNSNQRTIENISLSGNKIVLTISGSINTSDIITVDYIKPATNPVQNISGQQLMPFSDRPILNNIGGGSELIIHPNPATKFINISVTGAVQTPQIIRIYDLSGRLHIDLKSDTEFLYRIPVDLSPGVYIIYMEVGSENTFAKKLIVIE